MNTLAIPRTYVLVDSRELALVRESDVELLGRVSVDAVCGYAADHGWQEVGSTLARDVTFMRHATVDGYPKVEMFRAFRTGEYAVRNQYLACHELAKLAASAGVSLRALLVVHRLREVA